MKTIFTRKPHRRLLILLGGFISVLLVLLLLPAVLTPVALLSEISSATPPTMLRQPSEIPPTVLRQPDEKPTLLSVPVLSQYPDYPTGCEVVTATMALHYMGEPVSVDTLIDRHLSTSTGWYRWKGVYYGPDPSEYFLGNPRSTASYGCYAPVIRNMLISYLGDEARVTDATGLSLSALCERYIDCGVPVILWATMNMSPIKPGASWVLPDGSTFTWPGREHCLLLVGYDEDAYYFNDPREGKCLSYPKATVQKRYAEMGNQALVINS